MNSLFTVGAFFPGFRNSPNELDIAPLKLLSEISSIDKLVHFFRGRYITCDNLFGTSHVNIGSMQGLKGFVISHTFNSYFQLKRNNINALYCYEPLSAYLLLPVARLYKLPLILQIGIDWEIYDSRMTNKYKNKMMDYIRKRTVQQADEVVVLADHLSKQIESLGRIPHVFYPYIPSSKSTQPSKRENIIKHKYKFLFLGRFASVKGAQNIAEAIPYILRERDDVYFRFVGQTDVKNSVAPYIRGIISKNKLDKYVDIIGHIPNTKVDEQFQISDAIIMPSFTEGFHYTLLEAWSAGLPVLASDIPFHRELITADTGLIFENTPQGIARSVLEFIEMDMDKIYEMKVSSKNRAEEIMKKSKDQWANFFFDFKERFFNR